MSAGEEIPEFMVRFPKSLSDPSLGDSEYTFYERSEAEEFIGGLTGNSKVRGFEMRADMFERTITVSEWKPTNPRQES